MRRKHGACCNAQHIVNACIPEVRSSEDIFEINDEVYEDIQLSFLHAGRTKTVRLNNIDKFSMVEDVPDYVFIDDRNGGQKLIEYMEQTANNYASKMIFVRN